MGAVERTYRCDLCRDTLHTASGAGERLAIGLHFNSWPKGWIMKRAVETERHLCPVCVSSIQAMQPTCGKGFPCDGGPACNRTHAHIAGEKKVD